MRASLSECAVLYGLGEACKWAKWVDDSQHNANQTPSHYPIAGFSRRGIVGQAFMPGRGWAKQQLFALHLALTNDSSLLHQSFFSSPTPARG